MSRSTNPFTIPAGITAKVGSIMSDSRRRYGHGQHFMTATPPEPVPPAPASPTPPTPPTPPAAPQRPEGVSEAEWNALGDPGKLAIVREREARTTAEHALAAARARPTPPVTPPAPPTAPAAPAAAGATPPGPDLEAIVQQAVAAAVKPFQDREEQRDAAAAVKVIQDAVATAAKETFHDTSDAITGVDLTQITDGSGGPDATKIKTALDELLKTKPHLGKVPDGRLYAQPGFGAGESGTPLETRVQDILTRMQATAGIKPPPAS